MNITPEKQSDLSSQLRAILKNPPPRPSPEEIKAAIEKRSARVTQNAPPAPIPYGPGTELSKLFALIGITYTPDCSCRRHVREMDKKGWKWCSENIDTILGWLEAEAKTRNIPFIRTVATRIIKLAVWNGKRKSPKDDAIHIHHTGTGLGDSIVGLYAACGLADATGQHVVYHAHSSSWLSRAKHPNVFIVPIEDGVPGPDLNGGWDGYMQQISSASSRVTAYCANAAKALAIDLFKPVRPKKINRKVTNPPLAEKYIVLAPFSVFQARAWPREKWRQLAVALTANGVKVIGIGASKDVDGLAETFKGTGATWYWGQAAHWVTDLLLGAKCVVGNDSGIAHLCGLLEVPCIAVHAGTLPHDFLFDMGPSVRSVTADSVRHRSDHSPDLLAGIPAQKVADAINRMTGSNARIAPGLADFLPMVAPYTLLDIDRLRVIFEQSHKCSAVAGDIAELGVYKGGTSLMLSLANPLKTIHSFDTFTGIPNAKAGDDIHVNGDFDLQGSVPAILQRPNIIPHVGLFPGTADPSLRFCFAHFDGDTYESCIAFIDYFVPRMNAGGVMVFDDYKWHRCPGVERAMKERFPVERIIQTGPMQAMVAV